MPRVFVSDCEGPISKNDNAYELMAAFVPDGDRLFSVISKYDDVLADVVKKPGYNAGDTLKLILPFMKAYGISDGQLEEFSAKTLLLIAGTKQTLQHITRLAPAFIVTTSYEQYIKALCKAVNFQFECTYCTRLSLDKYFLPAEEQTTLKAIAKEIAAMPLITIPAGAKSVKDFSAQDRALLERLDEIFWHQIPALNIGKIFKEITTIGGPQKAEAIKDLSRKLDVCLSDVMYVGDSITDVQAFELVRGNGGLSVSFNGNGYAVCAAEVAVIAENNLVTAVLADVFLKQGKEATLSLVKNWSRQAITKAVTNPALLEHFFSAYPNVLPKVQIPQAAHVENVVKESSEFRKQVRGQAIGRLG
jgi:energy-converting hydrogenase A subunit R